MATGKYRYACECPRPDCRLRITLTFNEYDKRAARGPVVHPECRSLAAQRRAAGAALRAMEEV